MSAPPDITDIDLKPLGTFPHLPIVEWTSSRGYRLRVMQESSFPLDGDIPAFLVANQVARTGAQRPSNLATVLEYSASNVSKCVARLEDAGLARRVPDPQDDRAVLVALTSGGRIWAARMIAWDTARFESMMSGWSEAERLLFNVVMEKYAESARLLMEEDWRIAYPPAT